MSQMTSASSSGRSGRDDVLVLIPETSGGQSNLAINPPLLSPSESKEVGVRHPLEPIASSSSESNNNKNKDNSVNFQTPDDEEGNQLNGNPNMATPTPAILEDDAELQKDYEKDYQNLLKLKQQMFEKNEGSSLRRNSRCCFPLECPKATKPREWKLLMFVSFLFVVIIVGLVVIYQFHEEELYYIYHGHNVVVNEKTLDMEILNNRGESVLSGHLWRTRPGGKLPYDCSEAEGHGQGLCLLWKRLQQLHVMHHDINSKNASCYEIHWEALSLDVGQMDCFDLADAQWFGGGLLNVKSWPLQKSSFPKRPFITGDLHDSDAFGPVLERYWLSSKGVAIVVKENSPLHVSINNIDPESNATDGQICLYADYDNAPYTNSPNRLPVTLDYTICVGDDIIHAHETSLPLFSAAAAAPTTAAPYAPPKSLFVDPVWSTWAYLKDAYNQTTLTEYAKQIADRGYGHGLLLVDDGWESHYGDMAFVGGDKFDDPKAMIEVLHREGFRVSMWFHPQLNTDSLSFQHATLNEYLVRDIGGDVPGLTRWWNGPHSKRWCRGVAGVIDMSDKATSWHRDRLNAFKTTYGIDSFHFAGGEIFSLPVHPTFSDALLDPNDYTRQSAELASTFGNMVSVQSAYKCQNLSILIRLADGTSTWNGIGGLQSIIPSVLTLGIIGYPFIIPEAVGGSAFDGPPSKELYIRWLQLSTFLPIMHLSIPPENYDNDTATIALGLLQMHKQLVVPEVDRILGSSTSGPTTPIVRPMWWSSPKDAVALACTDQFLLGEKILVAPVLEEGQRSRDVYLTEGIWEDKASDTIHIGPKWLYNYRVPLTQIPYFILKSI